MTLTVQTKRATTFNRMKDDGKAGAYRQSNDLDPGEPEPASFTGGLVRGFKKGKDATVMLDTEIAAAAAVAREVIHGDPLTNRSELLRLQSLFSAADHAIDLAKRHSLSARRITAILAAVAAALSTIGFTLALRPLGVVGIVVGTIAAVGAAILTYRIDLLAHYNEAIEKGRRIVFEAKYTQFAADFDQKQHDLMERESRVDAVVQESLEREKRVGAMLTEVEQKVRVAIGSTNDARASDADEPQAAEQEDDQCKRGK